MKFKVGDFIRVIRDSGAGTVGRIKGTSWNSIHQEEEYVMKWDHDPREYTYKPSDVDHLWELDNTPLRATMDYMLAEDSKIKLKTPNKTEFTNEMFCDVYNHDWKVYDSGFSRFEYCAKCNEERK